LSRDFKLAFYLLKRTDIPGPPTDSFGGDKVSNALGDDKFSESFGNNKVSSHVVIKRTPGAENFHSFETISNPRCFAKQIDGGCGSLS